MSKKEIPVDVLLQNIADRKRSVIELCKNSIIDNVHLRKNIMIATENVGRFNLDDLEVTLYRTTKNICDYELVINNVLLYVKNIMGESLQYNNVYLNIQVARYIDNKYNGKIKSLGYNYINKYQLFVYIINSMVDTTSYIELYSLYIILLNTIIECDNNNNMFICKDMYKSNMDKQVSDIMNDPSSHMRQVLDYTIRKLVIEHDSLKRIYNIDLEELYEIGI